MERNLKLSNKKINQIKINKPIKNEPFFIYI